MRSTICLHPWHQPLTQISKFLLPLICGNLILTTAIPAQAQTAVHSVGAQTVQGTYETGVYEVQLGSTQGINISFFKTGETITRIWLDDPSRIVLDFDGCLAGAGMGGNAQGCGNGNGARLIHLRQLRSAIELPEEMSTGTGRHSMMTVLTDAGKIYQFHLTLGTGAPAYSLIEVIPAPPPTTAQMTSLTVEYQKEILDQLSRGLAYAEAQQLIDPTSAAYQQAKTLIALLQQGKPFAEAQTQSNIPRELVSRLRSWGSQQSGQSQPTR